jgi:serine phosphatase RsbU (regulator of sigma subunit)/tetratricopeptide (TPR) repeat protein
MATIIPQLSSAAREALCSRRYPQDLLDQIDALPLTVVFDNPWVALFQGRRLCRLHSRFGEAGALIQRALTEFRARRDGEGELWAIAEEVVMCYHRREFPTGVSLAEAALDATTRPYLQAELQFGRFLCLIGAEQLPGALAAGEAALAALDHESDAWLRRVGRVQMLRNIAAGYHYNGQSKRSTSAAEEAVAIAQGDEALASARPWCWYELALAYWRQGKLPDASEAAEQARRQAEIWQHQELWRWAVALQGHVLRDQGRLDDALAAYVLAGGWGELAEGPAVIQIRQGRLVEAQWSCDALSEGKEGLWRNANAPLLSAIIALKSGKADAALALLEPIPAVYQQANFYYQVATARLYQAAAALSLHRTEQAGEFLTAYLQFAATEEVLTCDWWMPELIEPLLLFALRKGIEPAWAQRILERRFLHEPSDRRGEPSESATELAIARRTQMALLPDAPPRMPDLDLAAAVLPASIVGGDFVGYFPFGAVPNADQARVFGLAVGDISGKGLAAALLLSGAVVALNTVAANAAPPERVAQAMHAAMQQYTTRGRMNIALSYSLLTQTDAGWSLRAVGCGAVPPLVWRATGKVEWLDTAGLPLGTLATMLYREVETTLNPGDTLLCMSDGVIEALDARRTLFGFERLEQTLGALPSSLDAHTILERVLSAIADHAGGQEQHDDITLVVVRVKAGRATS